MNEILISLGGILLAQLGLTIRGVIIKRGDRQSENNIKKDLLNLISDLKSETIILKDQVREFKEKIEDFTNQLNTLKKENLVLMKEYHTILKDYKEVKIKLENIETYAKFSKDLKTFMFNKTSYAIELIEDKNSNIKLNSKLKTFLHAGSKSLIEILYNILAYGIENVCLKVIESDFKDSEFCLRKIFSCDEMGVDKDKIKNIIYTEKDKFLTQLRKIIDIDTGIHDKEELRDNYFNICDNLLENIIIEIKNL